MDLDDMVMALCSIPRQMWASWQEALVRRFPVGHHCKEGVVTLLDMNLKKMWRRKGPPAHRAAVPVYSSIVNFGLVKLTECLTAPRNLTAELGIVHMQQLLYVIQGDEGRAVHASDLVPLCHRGQARTTHGDPHLGQVGPHIKITHYC